MSFELQSLWYSELDAAPDVCGGRVRARGTRLTVQLLRQDIGDGLTDAELKAAYPRLTAEHLLAVRTCSTRALKRIKQRAR